jgi:hypothetical protein
MNARINLKYDKERGPIALGRGSSFPSTLLLLAAV